MRQKQLGLYATILRLPWVADGLKNTDKAAIAQLLYIAVKDPSVADTITVMPSLKAPVGAALPTLPSTTPTATP